ncbi:MAG TPA: hypothetical protein VF070_19890 [Streptosporangiaceae bacterium]
MTIPDPAGHALDPGKACRPVLAHRLQEARRALALDVAGERLGDVDLDQLRPVGWFAVGRGLVGLDLDPPVA